ncbi:formin-G [Salix suchowensis]|nr:formin-G [Salix suchowensis]
MGKIWIEICLISARGLRRTSSLWKLQWFAVGWIDPTNKYCTNIDASGNANPTWKTNREPIFLRERLEGTATVVLKEFLAKYSNEVGSYQLRKRSSSKPQGFVDVSIHISEERISQVCNGGGIVLKDHNNKITLPTEGSGKAFPSELPLAPVRQPENYSSSVAYNHPMPYPANYSNPSVGGPSYPPAAGPSYQPSRTPPPPPPPTNVGYIPSFLPNTDYINMPSSVAAAGSRGPRPGLAMGVGAGALAAGAVIFGDDFMSGFDVLTGLNDPSLTITTNPPF